MNHCSANIISFTLIKSIHNVQKAKFKHVPNDIEKARGSLSVPHVIQASIHFHQAESTLWTEVGQAHRPEAESRNGKQQPGCISDWANNVAGLTDSPRKRPLIRPLHVHPCQHLKKRQEEKAPVGLRRCWHRF